MCVKIWRKERAVTKQGNNESDEVGFGERTAGSLLVPGTLHSYTRLAFTRYGYNMDAEYVVIPVGIGSLQTRFSFFFFNTTDSMDLLRLST
jgi:hypothetical protein